LKIYIFLIFLHFEFFISIYLLIFFVCDKIFLIIRFYFSMDFTLQNIMKNQKKKSTEKNNSVDDLF